MQTTDFGPVWKTTLRMIGRRPLNRALLRQKLMARFKHNPQAVEAAVCKAQELHLIDEERFADMWIAHWVERGASRLFVLRKSESQGIPRATAEAVLNRLNYDEAACARLAARQKMPSLQSLSAQEARQKLMAFLQRRGFPYRIAKAAILDLL